MERNYGRSFIGDYDPPYRDTNSSYQWHDSQANYYEMEPNYYGGNPYTQLNNFTNFGESVDRSQDNYSNMHNSGWSNQPTNTWSRPIEMRPYPPFEYMHEEGPNIEPNYQVNNPYAQFNNFSNFGGNMSRTQQDYSNMPHSGWSNHPNNSWSSSLEMQPIPPSQNMHEERPSMEDMMLKMLQNQEALKINMKRQLDHLMSVLSENPPEDSVGGPVDSDHPEAKELEDALQSFDEVLTVKEDVVDEAQVVVDGGDTVEEGVMPHDAEECLEDLEEAVTIESVSQKSDDDADSSNDEDVSLHTEEAQRSNILADCSTSFVLPSPSPQRVQIRVQDKQFLNFLDTSLELPTYLSFVDFSDPLSSSAKYWEVTPKNKRKLDFIGVAVFDTECSTVKKHKLSPKLLEFHPP